MKIRIDRDSLGGIEIPVDMYYGPVTARAIEQYHVTGTRTHSQLINAFIMIKHATAITNIKIKMLNKKIGIPIIKACNIISSGKYMDQFVIDAINSGAGTVLNMNVNEVIANVALEISGKEKGQYEYINPNDHVNMSQSTNDTFPTAMNISIINDLRIAIRSIEKLKKSLIRKAKEFSTLKKIGRTHLMDALPVTLGNEFNAYATAVSKSSNIIIEASKELEYIALGGTAVGTGANTKHKYRKIVIAELSKLSNISLKAEKDMQYSIQSRFSVSNISSTIKNFAVEVNRISNDIRLMSSGPTSGLSEINIPAVHAGSSIMPGKINPSLAECMNMICFNIIGNDTTISNAVQNGQFELNVMMPVMIKCILESIDMLKNFLPIFSSNLIDGITANKKVLKKYMERNPVIVTLLTPKIGYMNASKLFNKALNENRTIREIVISEKLLTEEEFDLLIQ